MMQRQIWKTDGLRILYPWRRINVPWNEVPEYMHVESCLKASKKSAEAASDIPESSRRPGGSSPEFSDDKELKAIFERTYGPVKPGVKRWDDGKFLYRI